MFYKIIGSGLATLWLAFKIWVIAGLFAKGHCITAISVGILMIFIGGLVVWLWKKLKGVQLDFQGLFEL